jgi:heptose-I-phosphate ethanolaminephosphotransferase
LKLLTNRLYIGLVALGAFWTLGMLSANELAKTSVLMTACVLGLVGLLALGRPKVRWLSGISIAVYLLFFLDIAIKGFLRDYFGLRPNHSMVLQAVLNTNPGEAQEFFMHHWPDVGEAVLAFLVISVVAILAERRLYRTERRRTWAPPSRAVNITVVTMFFLFVAMHFNSTMAKENPLLFWPLRYVHYQEQLAQIASLQQEISRNMAKRSEWSVQYVGQPRRTVVWVIGESVNRANMSLYSYPRRTTPQLDAMRDDLIVFKDVVSPESATMGSLMKMLTPANLDSPDEWSKKPDVLMLAKEAGYKTIWLSNQAPTDGWLDLVAGQANERTFINKGAGRGENNLDANLLPHFERALADNAPRKLVVVHLLGAHPSYDMRYPEAFSRFDGLDDTVSRTLTEAGRSRWIKNQRDEYDNAILYNDYVIGRLIERTVAGVQDHSASLLFSSDHGQEVGHFRNHAGQSVVDKSGYEIPMIIWQSRPGKFNADRKSALEHRPYQTDHLEHTILGLLNIRAEYYDATHDLMSDEFIPRVRRINGQLYAPDVTTQQ